MWQRDSIDPAKMAIEGSSTFTSEQSVNDASQNETVLEPEKQREKKCGKG